MSEPREALQNRPHRGVFRLRKSPERGPGIQRSPRRTRTGTLIPRLRASSLPPALGAHQQPQSCLLCSPRPFFWPHHPMARARISSPSRQPLCLTRLSSPPLHTLAQPSSSLYPGEHSSLRVITRHLALQGKVGRGPRER